MVKIHLSNKDLLGQNCYFSKKICVVNTYEKRIGEVVLINSHSICFLRERITIYVIIWIPFIGRYYVLVPQ